MGALPTRPVGLRQCHVATSIITSDESELLQFADGIEVRSTSRLRIRCESLGVAMLIGVVAASVATPTAEARKSPTVSATSAARRLFADAAKLLAAQRAYRVTKRERTGGSERIVVINVDVQRDAVVLISDSKQRNGWRMCIAGRSYVETGGSFARFRHMDKGCDHHDPVRNALKSVADVSPTLTRSPAQESGRFDSRGRMGT